MKIVSRLIMALTLAALTGSVFAQSVSVGSVVGQKGNSVDVQLTFTAGVQPVDYVQFQVDFANPALANFSSVAVATVNPQTVCAGNTGNPGNSTCVVNAESTAFFILVSNGNSLLTSGVLATYTFTIDAAAPVGDVALVVNTDSVEWGRSGVVYPVSFPVTDGNIQITDGPQPVYGSNPTAAAGVSMSGQISNIIAADVIVNNNAGENGTTLTYSCSKTDDQDGVFSLAGSTTNANVPKGSTATVSVGCDSSAIGNYAGEMTCTSNGGANAVYALSCTVNAGPEPAYMGVASGLAMAADEQGDANPAGSVTITNTGDVGTSLTGTCSLTGPDSEISLTSSGNFSVNQGAGGAVVAVACNASAEGSFSNTLSCSHNGTNVATPVEYAVSCEVGPPGAAVYQSNPAVGATIELTPSDVPVDAVVPNKVLTITNAAPEANDRPLEVTGCEYVGDAAITVGAPPSSPIAPMASSTATFSCDTSTIGDFTGTYTCSYAETGGAGPVAVAEYPVHCGVRAAASEISVTPAPGSVLSMVVGMFGSGTVTLTFSEILDEGIDATVDSCSLEDGTNFEILTAFPLIVPAGGTAQVQVQGTDPANGALGATDVLTCQVTDSNGSISGDWDLVLTVQTAAIPTLSTWGLLAMFLTMLSLGGIVIRRKARS